VRLFSPDAMLGILLTGVYSIIFGTLK